jgi:ribosome-associated translation inhibitor RaiA
MTLNLQKRFFRGNGSLAAKAERGLSKLAALARIEKAQVVLERRRASSPPFVARLHLAVPGPDLHASAQGFTPESALEKALQAVAQAMRGRKSKIELRQKQNPPGLRPWGRSHQPAAAGW